MSFLLAWRPPTVASSRQQLNAAISSDYLTFHVYTDNNIKVEIYEENKDIWPISSSM